MNPSIVDFKLNEQGYSVERASVVFASFGQLLPSIQA